MQQVQENVFTTDSFSQLDLHPHLVSGRKATCLRNMDFWVGVGQRAFIHGDLDTSPDFVTVLVCVLTCPSPLHSLQL